jgi:hypothetical protein
MLSLETKIKESDRIHHKDHNIAGGKYAGFTITHIKFTKNKEKIREYQQK